MPDADAADLLLHEMRGIPFVRSGPVPLHPVTVPQAWLDELHHASRELLAILFTTLRARASTPQAQLAALGQSDRSHPYFTDSRLEADWATSMARPDVVFSGGTPRFLEFNIGGAIGGVVTTDQILTAYDRLYRHGPVPYTTARPFAVRADLYERAARSLGRRPGVAILGSVRESGFPDNDRYFRLEADYLRRRRGIPAEFFEPEDLLDGLGDGIPRFPVGLRHLMIDAWHELGIDPAPLGEAQRRGCLMLAPQTAFLISNKLVLAWASAGGPWLSRRQRELTDRYLPWTRIVRDGPVEYRGRRRDLPDLLRTHQRSLVLKPSVGNCGTGVAIGARLLGPDWNARCARALREGTWVVQEYVEPDRFPCRFWDRSTARTAEYGVAPVVSPLLFDGRPAGCFARHDPFDRTGVVSTTFTGASFNAVVGT
ncbi:hypothetical protein ACFYN3_28205 [Streptomyces lavendulae]|uniref:hypothetical protein n=1 Tax=Streptomyces lavendulae TaxID=1914 RepID=UPI00368A82BD